MKKLIIFGDSYANHTWYGENERFQRGWGIDLANRLNIPMINYGVAGSSLIYSFHKFWEYFNSEKYHEEDIIIFITTETSRTYFRSMPGPHLGNAASLLHYDINYPAEHSKWMKENFESNIWTQYNVLDPIVNFDEIQVVSCLSILAEKFKKNKWILFKSSHTFPPEAIKSLNYIITPSDNFFPYISDTDTLFIASVNEFVDYPLFASTMAKGPDKRINHLTKPNRDIFVNMLFDVINTNNMQGFNIGNFMKNIYVDEESAMAAIAPEPTQ